MGPLVMTGLMAMGAAAAIGWIASRAPASARPGRQPDIRAFAIVGLAFAAGIGVLGVVVGLLAVTLGLNPDSATTGYVAGAVPAVLGAIVGLVFIGRDWSRLDPSLRMIGLAFVISQAVMAVVVSSLAGVIRETGTGRPPGGIVFLALGAVGALGTLGIGMTAGRGLGEVANADDASVQAARSRALTRIVPFDVLGVAAAAVGIVLLVTART
jgi:F0F1-type ATP synthase membrane subunit c/vacuolar-type H+-ATPase subunit K